MSSFSDSEPSSTDLALISESPDSVTRFQSARQTLSYKSLVEKVRLKHRKPTDYLTTSDRKTWSSRYGMNNVSDLKSCQSTDGISSDCSDSSVDLVIPAEDFQQSVGSGSDSFQEESHSSEKHYNGWKEATLHESDSMRSRYSRQGAFDGYITQEWNQYLVKLHRTYVGLWRSGTLCDIIFVLGDAQIAVHSAVVVGHSGLCEKETREFHSTNTPPVTIYLNEDIVLAALEAVVAFMYSAKVEIVLENLMSIQRAAQELQIYAVTARCSKILERLLQDQNIIQTFQVAAQLDLEALERAACSTFSKHFKTFCSLRAFLEANLVTILRLLGSDYLVPKSEFEVLEAALAWMNFRRAERISHLEQLMSCVRLIHMTDEELVRCMQYDPLFSASPGIEILAQAHMNKMLLSREELPREHTLPKSRTFQNNNCQTKQFATNPYQ